MTIVLPDFVGGRQFLGPPWLTVNGESGQLGFALDVIKNAFVERCRLGLMVRFPQQDPQGTPAPDDALAAMGRDRRMVRGISETSKAYAARLLTWLDVWATAGNPFTLMNQLAAYMGPLPDIRTVDVRGNWFTRLADGTQSALLNQANWDWDGAADALARWSRFWVIIYPNGLWTSSAKWGDGGQWGDGRTWGSSATSDQVQTIKGIVKTWKPAGTRCINIILAFDNTTFLPTTLRDGTGLPDGTWGSPAKIVGGVSVPSRLSSARYWDGS